MPLPYYPLPRGRIRQVRPALVGQPVSSIFLGTLAASASRSSTDAGKSDVTFLEPSPGAWAYDASALQAEFYVAAISESVSGSVAEYSHSESLGTYDLTFVASTAFYDATDALVGSGPHASGSATGGHGGAVNTTAADLAFGFVSAPFVKIVLEVTWPKIDSHIIVAGNYDVSMDVWMLLIPL
jgi:hypothetical protein